MEKITYKQLEMLLKQMDCIKGLIKEKRPSERTDFGYCGCQITDKLGDAINNEITGICICPYARNEIESMETNEGKIYVHKCDYVKKIIQEKQD